MFIARIVEKGRTASTIRVEDKKLELDESLPDDIEELLSQCQKNANRKPKIRVFWHEMGKGPGLSVITMIKMPKIGRLLKWKSPKIISDVMWWLLSLLKQFLYTLKAISRNWLRPSVNQNFTYNYVLLPFTESHRVQMEHDPDPSDSTGNRITNDLALILSHINQYNRSETRLHRKPDIKRLTKKKVIPSTEQDAKLSNWKRHC